MTRLQIFLMSLYLPIVFFASAEPQKCGDQQNYCLVSLYKILVVPSDFDDLNVRVSGYARVMGKGPYKGLWLSPYSDQFDLSSSIKVDLKDSDVESNWLSDGSFVSVTGRFQNCTTMNCRPQIIRIKDKGLVFLN